MNLLAKPIPSHSHVLQSLWTLLRWTDDQHLEEKIGARFPTSEPFRNSPVNDHPCFFPKPGVSKGPEPKVKIIDYASLSLDNGVLPNIRFCRTAILRSAQSWNISPGEGLRRVWYQNNFDELPFPQNRTPRLPVRLTNGATPTSQINLTVTRRIIWVLHMYADPWAVWSAADESCEQAANHKFHPFDEAISSSNSCIGSPMNWSHINWWKYLPDNNVFRK